MIVKSLHDFLIRDPKTKELYVNAIESQAVDISSMDQIVDILGQLDPQAQSRLCPEEKFNLTKPLTETFEEASAYATTLKSKSKQLFRHDDHMITLRRARNHFLKTFEYKGQRLNESEEMLLKQNSNFEDMIHEAQLMLEKKAMNAFQHVKRQAKGFNVQHGAPRAPQPAAYSAPQQVAYSAPQQVAFSAPQTRRRRRTEMCTRIYGTYCYCCLLL